MIMGTAGRNRAHEESLEAIFFVDVRVTIRAQVGPMDPEILNFQVIMAPKSPKFTK